jgi:nucleotide-binding universal stress UspA family protein
MSAPTTASPPDTTTLGSWYPAQDTAPAGPILVATDGTPAGDGAFRAASLIAGKSSAKIPVFVVIEPLPVLIPQPSLIAQPVAAPPDLFTAVRDRVAANIRELAPEGLAWHVEVEYGRPSTEIAKKAREINAQLVVIGLVHHGVMDRVLDGDTALEIVRHSHTPVLLATADWKALPVRAVFAVDFSAQSMEAARAGLRLMGDGSTVILTHVRSIPMVSDGMGLWEIEYEEAAKIELARLVQALNAPPGIRVEQALLRGSPSPTILAFADEKGADLVVAGTRGAGLVERLLLGSVATRLMRHSTRSLLVVPDVEE